MTIVHLSNLAVERSLSLIAEPGLKVAVHLALGERTVHSASDVCAQDRFVDVPGQFGERVLVSSGGLYQGGPVRTERNRIDQRQGPIVAPVEQVRP